jgi:hypothetical protein
MVNETMRLPPRHDYSPSSSSNNNKSNNNGATTPSGSSRRPTSPRKPSVAQAEEDKTIRRGAAILREQIRKQMMEMGERLRSTSPVPEEQQPPQQSPTQQQQTQPRHQPRSLRENKPWQREFNWAPPQPQNERKTTISPSQLNNTASCNTSSSSSSDPPARVMGASTQGKDNRAEGVDDFTNFSDPFKVKSVSSSVEVDPPEEDDWEAELELELTKTYDLKRTPTPELNHKDPIAISPPPSPRESPLVRLAPESDRKKNGLSTAVPMKPYALNVESQDSEEEDSDIASISNSNHHFFMTSPDKSVRLSSITSPESLTSPLGTQFIENNVYTYTEKGSKALVTPPTDERFDCDSSRSSLSTSPGRRYSQLNHLGGYEEKERSRSRIMGNSYLPMSLQSNDSSTASTLNSSPKKKSKQLEPPSLVDEDDFLDEYSESPVKEVPARSSVSKTVTSVISSKKRINKVPPSRSSKMYDKLLNDPAYLHAQSAGFLWQSLVGQHIKFPTTWWNGARSPPIGDEKSVWIFYGRHTVAHNNVLNQLVRCRASAGRLLLHIIVLDVMSRAPMQDIAIGCFHPNSKSVRKTPSALRSLEDSRDIWMGVRKRTSHTVSAVDSLLYSQSNDETCSRSPLGPGQRITNNNVRTVFGEKPPLETIFMGDDELYERLASRLMAPTFEVSVPPPLAILHEFVFA